MFSMSLLSTLIWPKLFFYGRGITATDSVCDQHGGNAGGGGGIGVDGV
jgi:hypothetical protein